MIVQAMDACAYQSALYGEHSDYKPEVEALYLSALNHLASALADLTSLALAEECLLLSLFRARLTVSPDDDEPA